MYIYFIHISYMKYMYSYKMYIYIKYKNTLSFCKRPDKICLASPKILFL